MNRMMRITMVGASNSGKTSFLSGVYQSMVDDDVNGLRFLPVGEMSKQMSGISRLSEVSIVENGLNFAPATASTTTFPLMLVHGTTEICKFEFIDYRGGAIDDMFDEETDNADASEIQEHIRTSDAVLVFADSILLNHYTNVQQCRLATKANRINILFNLLSERFEKKNLSVILVLTKADDPTIHQENQVNYFMGLREKALNVFKKVRECVRRRANDHWSFGIVPVSAVGLNAAKTEMFDTQIPVTPVGFKSSVKPGHFPAPFGIDIAMVYSIWCVLQAWRANFEKLANFIDYRRREIHAEQKKVSELVEQIEENKEDAYVESEKYYKQLQQIRAQYRESVDEYQSAKADDTFIKNLAARIFSNERPEEIVKRISHDIYEVKRDEDRVRKAAITHEQRFNALEKEIANYNRRIALHQRELKKLTDEMSVYGREIVTIQRNLEGIVNAIDIHRYVVDRIDGFPLE